MAEIISDNIYLVMLLPLWIFLIIMLGRFFSVYVNPKIAGGITLVSQLYGAAVCLGVLCKMPSDAVYDSVYPFIHINDFIIPLGIQIDRLGAIFGLTLFLTAFFVHIFALSYMKEEKKSYRFFALMNLFVFAMAGLFFSPNLFQTYVFWEIAGIASYLLIGFEYNKPEKSLASKKVFIINRIGDTALIAGIIMSSYFMYQYASDKSLAALAYTDMSTISSFMYAYTSPILFKAVCLLFVIAGAVKSAQIPFYTWLQDAMEAKLPVSALLHSATLVAAGLFVVMRMTPFFVLDEGIMKMIIMLGLLTAVICSISACAQKNPKKTLAYSTSAQFGLIYAGIGVMNIRAAVALYIAHAFIKSLLFILLPKEDEEWNYFNCGLFFISGLSLSGLIFAGMNSKEMLALNMGNDIRILFCIISFLTAFYIIRLGIRLMCDNGLERRKPDWAEFLSATGLLALNVLFYILLRNFEYKIAEPFWFALAGVILVYLLYKTKGFREIPLVYSLAYNGFYLDKFYLSVCVKVYEFCAHTFDIIDRKVFGEYRPIIWIAGLGVKIFNFIETKIMDGAVKLLTKILKSFSKTDLRLQNGNIQKYNAYAFIIVTLVITCLILAYVINIINHLGGI